MKFWITSINAVLCILFVCKINVDSTDTQSRSNPSGDPSGRSGTQSRTGVSNPSTPDPNQQRSNPGQTRSTPDHGSTPVTTPDPELQLYTNDDKVLPKDKYDLDKSVENFLTYKLKDGVKCTLVTCDGRDVWKLDTGTAVSGTTGSTTGSSTSGTTTGNPLTILHNKSAKVVLLTFKDDVVCSLKLEKGQWKEQFKGKPEQVTLDTKSSSVTNEFDYKKDDKVVTFTAKSNNVFNSVKAKDKEIWKTDKTSEYATKVVLKGKGQKNKSVTITFLNGEIKGYGKEGKGKPWVEQEISDGGGENETVQKTKSSSYYGTRGALTIDVEKKIGGGYHEYKKDGDNHIFWTSSSFGFKAVKCGSDEVWSTTDPSKYAERIVINTGNTNITIHLPNNKTKEFTKSENTWSEKSGSSSGTGSGTEGSSESQQSQSASQSQSTEESDSKKSTPEDSGSGDVTKPDGSQSQASDTQSSSQSSSSGSSR